MKITFILTAIVPALLAAQTSAAQSAKQSTPQTTPAERRGPPLPPDDPALYRLFFSFYDGLTKAIESNQQKNPTTGVKTQKGVARVFKIGETDVAQVAGVSRSFVTALAQLDNDRRNYALQARARHQPPDPARLKAFDLQRRQLTDDSVQLLISSLPAASWKELHSYINNQFRMQTGYAASFSRLYSWCMPPRTRRRFDAVSCGELVSMAAGRNAVLGWFRNSRA